MNAFCHANVSRLPAGTGRDCRVERVNIAGQETVVWSHGSEVYVSKGINVNRHWGTFVLYPGAKGKAIYIQDAPPAVKSVNLESIALPSTTDPRVHFHVYKESGSTRLWAFQINEPSVSGFVIYYKDGGEPSQGGWELYDFAD